MQDSPNDTKRAIPETRQTTPGPTEHRDTGRLTPEPRDRVVGPKALGTEPDSTRRESCTECLDHYLIHEQLGSGAQASVFLAQDCRSGEPVALKIANPNRLGRSIASIRSEFDKLSKVSHSNVVRVIEMGQNERCYFAMEYLRGMTLEEVIAHEPLTFQRAAAVGISVADGLAAVHAQKIIHRDIKPSNIMILDDENTAEQRVRLIDFGFAVEHGFEATALGTLDYAAPEVLFDERSSPLSDVFSLAVTLCYSIAGELPYVDNGSLEFEPIVHRPIELSALKGAPAAFISAITHALAPDPHERPTAEEFRDAMKAFEASGPPYAR